MYGLASGLDYLHNFSVNGKVTINMKSLCMVYHQDIKPRNIFGQRRKLHSRRLRTFSPEKTSIKTRKTLWKESTIEYGAPESQNEIDLSANEVGRSFDIWSLGCVLCEVGVYMETRSERRFQLS